MPYMYIVECSDETFYTGTAIDLEERIKKHNKGLGSKYTRGRIPVVLVYYEEYETIGKALKREKEIQKWPRVRKKSLIERVSRK